MRSHKLAIPQIASGSGAGSTSTDASSSVQHGDGDDGDGGFYYFPDFLSDDEERYLIEKIATAPLPKWKTLQNRRLQHWGGQLSKTTLVPEPLPSFFTTYPPVIPRIKEATTAFSSSKHGEPNHCLVNEYLSGQGLMPHVDGGAYFPCVATVSLGSHTLLDIYEWADEIDSGPSVANSEAKEGDQARPARAASGARARAPEPSFSIFQERRSLLITTGSAYKNYLHGIAERHADDPEHLAKVVNADQLVEKRIREIVHAAIRSQNVAEGEKHRGEELQSLTRDTRISLTFRDVEKVSKGLGTLLGKVKR